MLRGEAARGGAIGLPTPIRTGFAAERLRRLARRETDGRVAARLLGLATRWTAWSAAKPPAWPGWIVRRSGNRVNRCNVEGIEGLRDRPKSGRPTWLDNGQLATLKALVLRGPDPERDGVSTGRAKDLCRLVEDRFGISYTENGMLRQLHDLGLSWQKARPVHPEADLKAQERFEKNAQN